MSRKRYINSKISTDHAVNQLAQKYGDFAALLYTWMIPHASDDATLTGDPEELLWIVAPGRRDKTPEDVTAAVEGMIALRLLVRCEGDRLLAFPSSSFYRYQAYIKVESRAPERRITLAENGGNQRSSAEKGVTFPVPVPFTDPVIPLTGDAPASADEPVSESVPIPITSKPKPDRVADVKAAIKAIGAAIPLTVTEQDKRAIRGCNAAPALIADAYHAVYCGDWGDGWLRENLCLTAVIKRLAGYETSKRAPPKAANGRSPPTATIGSFPTDFDGGQP